VAAILGELDTLGVPWRYAQGDVSSTADRAQLLDTVRREFGRLDVLVNNAGVASPGRKDLLDADEAAWDQVLGVNLKGPYFLTQAAARWMIEQRRIDAAFRGVIVNISSVSAEVVSVNRGDYCISKAGLTMATRLWASRLAEYGIDVYGVQPGVIRSDMTAGVAEKYDRLIAAGGTLEPRWGTPEDVGRAVAALVRGELPYATGQILKIDGGLTIPRL
jgi:NAD(P)-dependent dehydrogenase (short-subunit alcohol dehydrogenase family)